MIAEINEQQMAMVAFPEDPAGNTNGLGNMVVTKLAAVMGAIWMHGMGNG
jgi:hypothetical protein